MRFIRYVLILGLALVLVVVALANRQDVTLFALPNEIAEFAGVNPAISLPLFVVIFGGIVAGAVLGFIWEWLREAKHRSEASTQRRERQRLQREVDRLKPASEKPKDEVLAILDGS